jgi:hypothetical protein
MLKLAWPLVLALLLVACTQCPDCICPKQNECTQQECPTAPASESGSDYAKCPKIVITKNVTFTKYVCANGRIVDASDECNAPVATTNLTPVLTNEKNSSIDYVLIEPACIFGVNGGNVKFKLNNFARDIWVQTRIDNNFKDIYHTTNLYEGSRLFAIGDKLVNSDFNLPKNMFYLLRLKFFIPSLNQTQYSNEHLISTNPDSDFMTKKCADQAR